MKNAHLKELLLQSLEHERGGVEIYKAAVACAVNDDLKDEWQKYLQQTQNHVAVLENLFGELSLDRDEQSPGRTIVHDLGKSLVAAIHSAAKAGEPEAAQLVACECVALAETKDHLNWELLSKAVALLGGDEGRALRAACEEVEDQEDEHLYHTKGWCRELWLESLGLRAVLPPPEERKHVKTAIGAARAEQARGTMRSS